MALFSGCPGSNTRDGKERSIGKGPNILRFDVPYPFGPFVLEPEKQLGSTFVFPFLFSYLAVPDHDGKLQGDLAERWVYNKQTFTWFFYLRGNARFHNGKPVTARDVATTLRALLEHPLYDLKSMIRRIETPTDTLMIVKLSQNDPKFLEKIWDMEILPEGETLDPLSERMIGSGPFVLKQRDSQTIVLEANEDYFLGQPSIGGIIFNFVPDKEMIWSRLMGGKTDVAAEITPENLPITQSCDDLFYMDYHTLPYYSIILYNTNDPLFEDISVRQALAHAVDRDYIVKKILKGNGKVAAGPLGAEPPYHNMKTKPLPYDPLEALRLIEQAGWTYDENSRFLIKDGRPFEFTLYVVQEWPIHELVSRYLRLCFNDIGIKLYVKMMPLKDLMQTYVGNTEFQAVLTEACGFYRGHEHLERFWAAKDSMGSQAGCFEDARVNDLFSELSGETQPEVQKRLLHEIDARIADLQPGTFLYHQTVCDVMSRRFALPGPFYLYPDRGWNLQFAKLQKNTLHYN